MREVVLDTETTGFDPAQGHRIVEIGCLELVNYLPTGHKFHSYVNPERDMPEAAFGVHGLSAEFLRDKPLFGEIAGDFLEFLGESRLVIHNAAFDLAFLNAELERIGRACIELERAIDTIELARVKFPGQQASLDALCRRFEIDLGGRAKHGALIDANLLALVYLELVGGREPGLALAAENKIGASFLAGVRTPRPALPPSAAELAAHGAFVGRLKRPIWRE
jgi:DNA polymerase-3 subunit epsilon